MTVRAPLQDKPLIVGMNNPLSDDPEYDLYPYPEGSAGWRLWQMMPEGTTRKRYLEAFDRVNLLRAREWDSSAAREAARELAPKLNERFVIVLGTEVRSALLLPQSEPLVTYHVTQHHAGVSFMWVPIPHPSGRNRWYNEPGNKERVRAFFADLMERIPA